MEDRTAAAQMDDNHWNTLQELLNAIGAMPDVACKIDAYMRGRDIDNPEAEIRALRKIAF